jgi:hypothetical protein
MQCDMTEETPDHSISVTGAVDIMYEDIVHVHCTEGLRTPDGRRSMDIMCTADRSRLPHPPTCQGKQTIIFNSM